MQLTSTASQNRMVSDPCSWQSLSSKYQQAAKLIRLAWLLSLHVSICVLPVALLFNALVRLCLFFPMYHRSLSLIESSTRLCNSSPRIREADASNRLHRGQLLRFKAFHVVSSRASTTMKFSPSRNSILRRLQAPSPGSGCG